jgi:hypothetical protein
MEQLSKDMFQEIASHIDNVDRIMVALTSKSCFALASPVKARFVELLLDRRGSLILVGRHRILEELAKHTNDEHSVVPLPRSVTDGDTAALVVNVVVNLVMVLGIEFATKQRV